MQREDWSPEQKSRVHLKSMVEPKRQPGVILPAYTMQIRESWRPSHPPMSKQTAQAYGNRAAACARSRIEYPLKTPRQNVFDLRSRKDWKHYP